MRRIPRARSDPDSSGGGSSRTLLAYLIALMISAGARTSPAAGTPGADAPSPDDTLGIALTQWIYDSWTVPWVRMRGASALLAPASNVTFMVLACETTKLDRDRLAQHLSAAQCEHKMAAIRADQDTALIFRVDLRVFDFPGAMGLIALDPTVNFTLEDDRGRRARVLGTERGPVLGYATAQKLKRIYGYHPPWVRGFELVYPQYDVSGGRSLTMAEHRVRFGRYDVHTGSPLVDGETRWLRLRLSYGRYEWVATWPFRPQGGERP